MKLNINVTYVIITVYSMELKKGIPPNYYLKEPFTEKVSKQDIFFVNNVTLLQIFMNFIRRFILKLCIQNTGYFWMKRW